MLVILFGLFHGIIFLPVILSIIGPEPYQTNEQLEFDLAAEKLKRKTLMANGDTEINEMTNLQHLNGIQVL